MFASAFATGLAFAQARPPPPLRDVAFYYADHPPLDELRIFDAVVVDPDHDIDPLDYARRNGERSRLYAYVSVGEADPRRAFYGAMDPHWFKSDNAAFGTRVIDQTAPEWRTFFVERVIAPLWARGYRGAFFDTLDAYQSFAKTDAERAAQAHALVELVRAVHARFPQLRLIFNRGFELLPSLADDVQAVAAESLYRGWTPSTGAYRTVDAPDRAWLTQHLAEAARITGRPSIAIDYVAPGDRALARETAQRIAREGFIPWVTDGALDQLGVGLREVVPRRVLLLTDNPEHVRADVLPAQRFVAMPLNYLGYAVDLVDLSQTTQLPAAPLVGRYAAIVTWLSGANTVHVPGIETWLARQIDAGLRVAMLNTPGDLLRDRDLAGALGFDIETDLRVRTLRVEHADPLAHGEIASIANATQLFGVRIAAQAQGRSIVRLIDDRGRHFDAVGIMPWGGFAFAPYTVTQLGAVDREYWAIQPIEFLRQALAPSVPAIDVTTENGLRIFMAHVDGDGFASRAELPGTPFAGQVLLDRVIRKYPLPMTVSVIEGEVGEQGLYPRDAPALEAIARAIFAQPNVEIASHTYSHPFDWAKAMGARDANASDAVPETYNLSIPGYRFDLAREIDGSARYIDTRLAPDRKRTRVLLWSGDCMPPAAAVAQAERAGLLNMNGGMTIATRTRASLTAVAPLGLRKDGHLQVYAPNQNENVYTHNWTGPFYGYDKVTETFDFTERPYRLKPIDVYFHTYSATKMASLAAVDKAFAHALAQPVVPMFASDYIRKVLDFDRAVFYRELAQADALHLRTDGDVHTVRVAHAAPIALDGAGVVGRSAGVDGDYVAFAGDDVVLRPETDRDPLAPSVVRASGTINDARRGPGTLHVVLALASGTPHPQLAVTAEHARVCTLTIDGRATAWSGPAPAGAGGVYRFETTVHAAESTHGIDIRCTR